MNMFMKLNDVLDAYNKLSAATPENINNLSNSFWEVRDEFMHEIKRLQAVEQTYLTRQENSVFKYDEEIFVGYGTYNSAYATYLIWEHLNMDDVLDIFLEAGKPETDDDFLAIAMTLKDRITYSYIFPEGADDKCDPSELQQDMIDGMADDIDWLELARKWNENINWEGHNVED